MKKEKLKQNTDSQCDEICVYLEKNIIIKLNTIAFIV